MKIVPFEKKYLNEAMVIGLEGYHAQRQYTRCLPPAEALPALEMYADNGLGVAAVQDGQLIGYLLSTPPFANAFRSTDAVGIFSPMGAHGACGDDRETVYERMYQAAAEKWVAAGAVSHAICLYAHDDVLKRLFFNCGFGLRCADAIRPMEPVPCAPCPEYRFSELAAAQYAQVYPLELKLHEHYRQSPFFMNRMPDTLSVFLQSAHEEEARFFAAIIDGQLCAYLKIGKEGENFAAAGAGYRHVHGAYCLPEHRGRGVYQNLMNAAIRTLKGEGFTTLGVDYESINPTARHFWGRHFLPYTASVVRRIDERILK